MKKKIKNDRVVAIAFFTIFNVTPTTLLANHHEAGIPVALQFIDKIKNQPVFQLHFHGDIHFDQYSIRIRDENGISLYNENIKGGSFIKKFILNTEELGDETLYFEISSKKLNATEVYQVNRLTFCKNELVYTTL